MPGKLGAAYRKILTGWPRESRLAIASLIVAVAATAVWLWWLCQRSDAIAFLPRRAPAEWVVCPLSPNLSGRGHLTLRATYTGSFELDRLPDSATLRICAWQKAKIRLNGKTLPTRPGKTNWKRVTEIDVGPRLRRGANQLAVTVVNDAGPPALWLSLTSPAGGISTDAKWQVALEGLSAQPVRLASAPLEFPRHGFSREQPWPSLVAIWPLLGVFAAISLAIFVLGVLWRKLAPSPADGRAAWPEYLLVGAGVLLWGALFWNNAGQLNRMQGFDAGAHLDYIQHILDGKGLPGPAEGGESVNPPLYYAVAAGILRTCQLTTNDEAGVKVLRYFSLLAAIASLVLLYASLSRIFPSSPQKRLLGWLTAAFLPAQLYQYQFVSNEILVAALGTLSVYLALRVIQSQDPAPWACAALGASLGATVLTKLSGLVVAGVVFGLLFGLLILRKNFRARAWLKTLALPMCLFLAVCGWHFARVAWYVGKVPLTSNDVAGWWQDSGYRVAESYCGLRHALDKPFYCGFDSVGDEVYASLWGDGQLGGAAGVTFRPPWNYRLVAAGFLLALLPTMATAIGLGLEIIAWLRRPRAESALVLGLAFAMGLAMLYMSLHLTMWCSPKAVYGLPVVVCLAVFAARGGDFLAGRNPLRRAIVYVALGTWVLSSYAAYWIVADSSPTLLYRAGGIVNADPTTAIRMLKRARTLSPNDGKPYYALGLAYETAAEKDLKAFARLPEDVRPSHTALLDAARRDLKDAEGSFRRALEVQPDHPSAASSLAVYAMRRGEFAEAIRLFEQSLRIDPDQAPVHFELGNALERQGRFQEAADHFDKAVNLKPDFKNARTNLHSMQVLIRRTAQPPSR